MTYFRGLTLEKLLVFGDAVTGDKIGIEVETEGRLLPTRGTPNNWDVKEDGSLRNGYEYVTARPLPFNRAEDTLKRLDTYFKDSGARIRNSIRCSVHVHVNARQWTFDRLLTFLTIYYSIEDILVRSAGPARAGNHFCLRLSDSDAPLWALIDAINEKRFGGRGLGHLLGDNIRYAALNLSSLLRFGTLEFRARGGINESPLEALDWINVLKRLVEVSETEFSNAQNVVETFSQMGPTEFLTKVLGTDILGSGFIQYDEQLDNNLLYEGMRRAQFLAYSPQLSDEPTKGGEKENTVPFQEAVRAGGF